MVGALVAGAGAASTSVTGASAGFGTLFAVCCGMGWSVVSS